VEGMVWVDDPPQEGEGEREYWIPRGVSELYVHTSVMCVLPIWLGGREVDLWDTGSWVMEWMGGCDSTYRISDYLC